jgi:ferredoxin-NADP reductase
MTSAWHVATVVQTRTITPTARSISLAVPGFAGALPGQHVDLRLTAPDGYQASRSYSLAAVGIDERVDVAVDTVPGGEVSTYLVEDLRVGDQMEVRGPLGGYFVWHPDDVRPVLLVAGGSGVAPFLAMIRSRKAENGSAPFRMVYSVRTPDDVWFPDELGDAPAGVEVSVLYTREAPPGWPRPPHRITGDDIVAPGFAPQDRPDVFVCGSTGFVEAVAARLTAVGHDAARIKTERFGGT